MWNGPMAKVCCHGGNTLIVLIAAARLLHSENALGSNPGWGLYMQFSPVSFSYSLKWVRLSVNGCLSLCVSFLPSDCWDRPLTLNWVNWNIIPEWILFIVMFFFLVTHRPLLVSFAMLEPMSSLHMMIMITSLKMCTLLSQRWSSLQLEPFYSSLG